MVSPASMAHAHALVPMRDTRSHLFPERRVAAARVIQGCSSSIPIDSPAPAAATSGGKQPPSNGTIQTDALEERAADDNTLPHDGKYAQQAAAPQQQQSHASPKPGARSAIVPDPSKPHVSNKAAGAVVVVARPTPPSSTGTTAIGASAGAEGVNHLSATKSPISSTRTGISGNSSSAGSSGGDNLVKEARRALADLSPFVVASAGADTDYFDPEDLEQLNWDELAMSIGLPSAASIASTQQQQGDGSVDSSAARSLASVQLVPANSDAAPRLEDFPQSQVEWRQGQLLGSGSFGKVYLGLDEEVGSLMGVKQVPMMVASGSSDPAVLAAEEQRLAKLAKEVSLLSTLSHPNIVEYRGLRVDPAGGQVNIFMEYVPGGSIAHLLKRFGTFSEKLVRRYTKEILHGLAYLHLKGVVHRDIKGGNILVDTNGRCKLADFGASFSIAEVLPPGQKPSIEGTPYWMAPEVIRQAVHGRKIDVWSLGCCVVEMISGRPPWQQFKSQISALYHIGSTSDPPALPDNLSEDGKDFVLYCLTRDPKERPNVLKLLEHPFITEPYTGPNTKVKLPPREKLKQSAAGEEGQEEGADSAQPGAAASAAAAATEQDGALKSEEADELEEQIAAFLRQEHEQLKQSTTLEQIKVKL